MATILTEENPTGETPGQQQPAGPTPTVVINNQQPTPEKKTSKLKKIVLIAAAVFAGVYIIGKYQKTKQEKPERPHTTQTAEKPQPNRHDEITWYGTINDSVLVAQHGTYGLWRIGAPTNGYEISSASSNGIILRDPAGRMHQRKWWIPPKTNHNHGKAPESPAKGIAKL